MKFLLLFTLILSPMVFSQANQKDVGSPPNAASKGTAENEGISDNPAGDRPSENRELRRRSESMGGAPNVGAGTGTGTGAGSTVGNELDEGTVTAGATSGEAAEE